MSPVACGLSKPDVQDQARHSIAEHKEADDLIEKLAEMDFSSPGWIAAAEELQHKMVHHMDEEEEDVFKLARQVLSENEINQLNKLTAFFLMLVSLPCISAKIGDGDVPLWERCYELVELDRNVFITRPHSCETQIQNKPESH